MKAEDTTAGHLNHWLVLLVGVLAAVSIWIWWLFDGMDRAHKVVLARAAPVSVASQRVNTNTSASAGVPLTAERGTMFTELGQTGDSFGSLNALLTAVAGALVFWAGFMQHQTLKQVREEAQRERANRQIQEFESLFFRLLELTATAVERIEGPMRKDDSANLPRHKGTRALDSLARSLFDSVSSRRRDQTDLQQQLAALVEAYLTKVYDRQPSAFGPYFRLLYQTFKHIGESALPESQQARYANIARGQISEGAVLLLAVNGLTPTGYKFVPLIEKFGLLEHLHRRYRTEYQGALVLGYRPRAFLGSEDRATPGNEWHEDPLLTERHFKNIEARREVADNQVAFQAGFHGEAAIDE